jgi:transcriptional regulator GlxA family with amidase domain
MREGETRIEDAARALATSKRSLQRHLAEAGLSFQLLVDEIRRDAADEYLADPALSVAEVAYLLGYSEAAAFHRAFPALERDNATTIPSLTRRAALMPARCAKHGERAATPRQKRRRPSPRRRARTHRDHAG